MTRASRLDIRNGRIRHEDILESNDEPARLSSPWSELARPKYNRSSLNERSDNRRAPGGCGCICGRDTRKWRLRPVRINWKWAVRADTMVLISSTTWRTHASPLCTPRCLLRPSSREPTLRLLCTSRTPVSFLSFSSFLCFSPFLCDWRASVTPTAIADVRFPRFSN